MKKYIQPQLVVLAFQTEGLVAASIVVDGDRGGAQQLSHEREGWSSDNWSDCCEEEF